MRVLPIALGGVVLLSIALAVWILPLAAGSAASARSQSGLYEGQFVRSPDGSVWLVRTGYRYQLWPDFIDPGLFDQATPGSPIASYFQLTGYLAAAREAPVALQPFDGTFVLGPDGGIWLMSGGVRYPITPSTAPAGALDSLPRGPDLRTVRGLAALGPARPDGLPWWA